MSRTEVSPAVASPESGPLAGPGSASSAMGALQWTRPHRMRIRWVDHPVAPLLLGLAILGLAVATAGLSPEGGDVSAWWPAAGLAIIALSWAPRDRRLLVAVVVLAASTLAHALMGRPVPMAVGLGVGTTLEAVVVTWWLLRGRSGLYLATLADVARLVVATALGVVVMGLTVAVLVQVLGDGDGDALMAVSTVMTGHAVAVLLTVPLAMRTGTRDQPGRRAEAVVQWLATLAALTVVFFPGQTLPIAFAAIPFLAWGALRLSTRTMCLQLAVVALLITTLTRMHGGPFASDLGPQASSTSSLVQLYLMACALIVLPLTVSITQRRAALHRVAASERLFRQSFSEALLGMMLLRRSRQREQVTATPGVAPDHTPDGLDVVELNAVAARILDGPPAELVGSSWTAGLDPYDRAMLADVVAAMADGTLPGWRGELGLHSSAGQRWVEVALSPLSREAGDGLFVAQMVDVTARRAAEERLTAEALRDSLTGLGNRALLHDRVERALRTLPRHDGVGVALLFCDLDDFKLVNESAGHAGGDVVLREVAQRLRALLRQDDVAARLGGDEFILLRPRASGPAEAERLAEAVLRSLSAPLDVGGRSLTVGASIGIAWGRRGDDADELLRQADAAMSAAKGGGKRRAVLFSEQHRTDVQRAVRVEAGLRRALHDAELEVHLQPVVDLLDGRAVAAEALVRWRDPELGLLPPEAWLDVAEAAGLMPEIGAWVLRRSCELATSWPAGADGDAPAVHVNVSARQLDVPGFFDTVHEVLATTGLAPGRLVLEFTETQLDDIGERLLADLGELRSLGVGLAADDYGTGYSPLTRIIELPLTMVKIDKGFVGAMLEDMRSQAIVTTLVRLSDSLGLGLVAEGVETREQAAALRLLGCVHGQGYLWSPPVSAEEFRQGLRAAADA